MNKFLKTLSLILLFFAAVPAFANNELEDYIKSSPLDKTSVVAVSVKEVKSGNKVFSYNDSKLLHPASVQKILTVVPSVDILGENYEFKTVFAVDKNKNLYIKAGADPLLTTTDLKSAVKTMKMKGFKEFNNVYLDGSIVDDSNWGIGWMSDDSVNTFMPKFGAFNIDGNLAEIDVVKNGDSITAKTTGAYKFPVINLVTPGNTDKIYADRKDWISPDIVVLKGNVDASETVKVPVNNLDNFFRAKLADVFSRAGIKLANPCFISGKTPSSATEIASISHDLSSIVPSILKDSDNKNAEIVFKVAGGDFANDRGCIANSLKMFYSYWSRKNLDTSNLIIVDGSGVSRNNLVTADFITDALNVIGTAPNFETFQNNFAQPGEGTLSNRLLDLRGSVRLKTGTLSNISSIAGFVKASDGKLYSVAILIQNFKYSQNDVKRFENGIIQLVEKM